MPTPLMDMAPKLNPDAAPDLEELDGAGSHKGVQPPWEPSASSGKT